LGSGRKYMFPTKKYLPQDLINLIKTEAVKIRIKRQRSEKKEVKLTEDTKRMKRRDQVPISRFRTGHSTATNGYVMNRKDNMEVFL
jgi:hypothetical protein